MKTNSKNYQGLGKAKREILLNGYKVSVWSDGKVLETVVTDAHHCNRQ